MRHGSGEGISVALRLSTARGKQSISASESCHDQLHSFCSSLLLQRLIDEMEIRRFGRETQPNHLSDVVGFATFPRHSPGMETAEKVRRFQVEQFDPGVAVPTMNSIVSPLRFIFTQALDRSDLARKLVRMRHERKPPVMLS